MKSSAPTVVATRSTSIQGKPVVGFFAVVAGSVVAVSPSGGDKLDMAAK
jgi:hypothetical protein